MTALTPMVTELELKSYAEKVDELVPDLESFDEFPSGITLLQYEGRLDGLLLIFAPDVIKSGYHLTAAFMPNKQPFGRVLDEVRKRIVPVPDLDVVDVVAWVELLDEVKSVALGAYSKYLEENKL